MYFFLFDLFLEARAEILEKISLVVWKIWRHQKDILKLTDLQNLQEPPSFKKNDPSQIPSAYEEYSKLISREKLVLWNEPCEKQSGSGAGQSTMLRFVHFCPVWSPQLNN